jgi:hypothetical protein
MRENREIPWSPVGVYWPSCPAGLRAGRIGRGAGREGNAMAVSP